MLENIKQFYPFIIIAVAWVLLRFLLRKGQGPVRNQQEIVQNLAREARLAHRMAEVFTSRGTKAERFITTTWQLHKDKLDFLEPSLKKTVDEAFMMAVDVNKLIGDAKKYKSASYLTGIDIAKLTDLMAKSQEGLEQWLLIKVGSRNPPERAPGLFDDLLGRR
jgi:hypothetical protein